MEEIGMIEKKELKIAPETTNIKPYEITVEKIIEKHLSEQEFGKDYEIIDKIIDEYNAEKGFLVSILQDLQEEYGFLTPEALNHISNRLDIPLIQVYQVAKFYKDFKFESLNEVDNKNRNLESSIKKDYLSKFTKKGV